MTKSFRNSIRFGQSSSGRPWGSVVRPESTWEDLYDLLPTAVYARSASKLSVAVEAATWAVADHLRRQR